MRARVDKLLAALMLTRNLAPGVKDFDLGSLRAGGATWMMQVTESPDVVRRRGRRVSNRVMKIYVQEVSALMYLPRWISDDPKRALLLKLLPPSWPDPSKQMQKYPEMPGSTVLSADGLAWRLLPMLMLDCPACQAGGDCRFLCRVGGAQPVLQLVTDVCLQLREVQQDIETFTLSQNENGNGYRVCTEEVMIRNEYLGYEELNF
ncbi:unnamed protein product, partial [Symbiodinium necroappetens]